MFFRNFLNQNRIGKNGNKDTKQSFFNLNQPVTKTTIQSEHDIIIHAHHQQRDFKSILEQLKLIADQVKLIENYPDCETAVSASVQQIKTRIKTIKSLIEK